MRSIKQKENLLGKKSYHVVYIYSVVILHQVALENQSKKCNEEVKIIREAGASKHSVVCLHLEEWTAVASNEARQKRTSAEKTQR